MDPFSAIVTVFALWAFLQRAPGLVGEAVREFSYARRGEESPEAAARRQRLIDAGVDPATGGAFRQYAGNVWRDYWVDKEAKRVAGRIRKTADGVNTDADPDAAGDESAKGWWARVRDRIDTETDYYADRWRARPLRDRHLYDTSTGDTADGQQVDGRRPVPEPDLTPGHEDVDIDLDGPDHSKPTDDSPPPPRPEPDPEPAAGEQQRPPIRVTATILTDPPHQPASPKPAQLGGPMSNALDTRPGNAVTVVTGVVSGAEAANALQRRLAAATAAYVAELTRIVNGAAALGEQTIGTVQMSQNSRVVAAIATAAEATAAAKHAVTSCDAEVSAVIGQIRREFNRINS